MKYNLCIFFLGLVSVSTVANAVDTFTSELPPCQISEGAKKVTTDVVRADLAGDGQCLEIGRYETGSAVSGLDRHFIFSSDERFQDVIKYHGQNQFVLWWVTPITKGPPYLVVQGVDLRTGQLYFPRSGYSLWMWNPKSQRLALLRFQGFDRTSLHNVELETAMIAHYRAVMAEAETLARDGKQSAAVLYMEHARSMKESMTDEAYRPLWQEFDARQMVYGVDSAKLHYEGNACPEPHPRPPSTYQFVFRGSRKPLSYTLSPKIKFKWIDIDGDGRCDTLATDDETGEGLLLLSRTAGYESWEEPLSDGEYVEIEAVYHDRDPIPYIMISRGYRGSTYTKVLRWNRPRDTFEWFEYTNNRYGSHGGGNPIAVAVVDFVQKNPIQKGRGESK